VGDPLLHWMVEDFAGTAALLLDLGVPADLPDRDGVTALQQAAKLGRLGCARLLLVRGAGANAFDEHFGENPSNLAVRGDLTDVVGLLAARHHARRPVRVAAVRRRLRQRDAGRGPRLVTAANAGREPAGPQGGAASHAGDRMRVGDRSAGAPFPCETPSGWRGYAQPCRAPARPRRERMEITDYHAELFAHELSRRCASDDVDELVPSLADAQVDLTPHQDEAALLLAQKWAEGKRNLLVILPADLRTQWSRVLEDEFHMPTAILETRTLHEHVRKGNLEPFAQPAVVLCSFQFARTNAAYIRETKWDLVVVDDGHRLRNLHRDNNKIARAIGDAIAPFPKVLPTATPLQNSLLEPYGLVSILDEERRRDLRQHRELTELVELGLVSPSKKRGRGASYRVTSPTPDTARPSPERVLALRLQSPGGIRNADYREIFGVERHAAKSELRELVRKGVLLRSGERRGTSYSRGAGFDAWLEESAKRP
jgi:hypothetical protein